MTLITYNINVGVVSVYKLKSDGEWNFEFFLTGDQIEHFGSYLCFFGSELFVGLDGFQQYTGMRNTYKMCLK